MEFVISCLRTLFFTLDNIVFGLIDDVYNLLMQLSRTTIFDQDALHSFSQRVYVMLGLFMLLKVMISIVNYILNPDDLVDKEKGFANIIKRIILSLVMIVLVPYVFREAYELQAIVLDENTIMTIIFGSPGEDYRKTSKTDRINSSFYDTAGQKIQFTVLYTFTQPNYEEFSGGNIDLFDCRETYKKDENGNFIFRDRTASDGKKKKSNYIYELNESCFGKYKMETNEYVFDSSDSTGKLRYLFENEIEDGDGSASKFYQNYAQGIAQQDMTLFFRKSVILAKTADGKYAINYKWGVSTAVGVAVVYLLLIFCVDIAGRSIKLGFLQLISPIPILSYCDPKSGKDGMFKKWYTMCFKSYAELFIKLFALYFGIYIISLVGTFKDVITTEAIDNWLVSLFMILGVLIFVKKLPEIIKDTLGVDLGGKLELNPLKKIENEAFGGKAITGAAAGMAGGVVGAATGAGLLRGVTGGLGGAFGGKGWSETWKNAKDKNAKLRTANLVDRNPFRRTFGRLRADVSDTLGTGGKLAEIERREANINREIDRLKAEKESAEAAMAPIKTKIAQRQEIADKIKAMQDRATTKIKQGKGTQGQIYQDMMQKSAGIRQSTSATGSVNANGRTYSWTNDVERGQMAEKMAQDAETYAAVDGRNAYINDALSNPTFDTVLSNTKTEYDSLAASYGQSIKSNADDLDTQSGTLLAANTTDRTTGEYARNEKIIKDRDDEIKVKNDKLRDISDEKKRYESYKNG